MKIFHSSVSIFDMDEVGSMEEIGKSLSFPEVSQSVLTKYIFFVCFLRYFYEHPGSIHANRERGVIQNAYRYV